MANTPRCRCRESAPSWIGHATLASEKCRCSHREGAGCMRWTSVRQASRRDVRAQIPRGLQPRISKQDPNLTNEATEQARRIAGARFHLSVADDESSVSRTSLFPVWYEA